MLRLTTATTALSLLATPGLAEAPRVVVDIAPVHALAARVMDGIAEPELLLEQDANPHAVQLRPSQARMLSDADLVIWVGPELSPWMESALESYGETAQIILMEHDATSLRDFTPPLDAEDHEDGDHDHGADHDHDADHDHGEEHGEHEAHDDRDDHDDHDDHGDAHAHGDKDPHVWLSVDNARAWVGAFADDLAARDPENAAAYRANADKADAELAGLIDRIEARLAPHRGSEIVTFHAAFGYFADRFDIEIAGSVRPGDATTASAGAIALLEEIVAEHGVECAFAEPAFDPGLLESIAGDTGLRIGTLDPTGALQTPGIGHYTATLYALADNLAACLEDG